MPRVKELKREGVHGFGAVDSERERDDLHLKK